PAAPNVVQLAPTTTTGSVTPPGDAGPGVDGADDACDLACAEWSRVRSNSTKPIAAMAITTSAMAVGTTTRRRGLASPLTYHGPLTAGANMVASLPASCSSMPMWWASARAKSMHRSYRSPGNLASALSNIGPRLDNSGRRVPIFGGSAVRCLLMTTAGLECWNGGVPVSSWNAVAASAYWSARPSISSPLSCSGAE